MTEHAPRHVRPAAAHRPATRWLLLVTVLAGLLASLALHALLRPAPSSPAAGASVLSGANSIGPLLDLDDHAMRSAAGDPAAVGIALVDTGEPADTPSWDRVAATLAAADVHATWLVQGRTVLDRSAAVHDVRAAGHELGVTGFSGRDLTALPEWRMRVELSTTQAVLAARERVTAPLLVLPGRSTHDTFDLDALRAAGTATDEGYAVVVGRGAEVAGPGDVAVIPLDLQAPARVDALLARARTAGLRAGTVSALARVDGGVNPAVDRWAQANAWAVMTALRLADAVDAGVDALFLPLTGLLAVRAIAGSGVAVWHARRQARRRRHRGSGWTGPVSVVVPAYNEAAGIAATIRSLVASHWSHGLEVIVVDDGSTDRTGAIAAGLALPGVRVIRQPNQGKPAALNTGIAAATYDIVVLVDGDTVFQPDTLAELVAPFADDAVGAVSGNAKVANRGSLLGRWQHVEYVMGFNLDRRLLDTCHAIPTVPGAVGAFDRLAITDAGGVGGETLAEDTDLTIAVQRAGWRVVYESHAVAWTEAPSSMGDLWRQRYRWSYGTLQASWKHRRALVEHRPIGLIGIPYALVFQVLLALVAPLVDMAALFGLLTDDARTIATTWLAFSVAQVLLAAVAFRLDGESLRRLWAVPLQQVVYRQLMYLVVIHSVAAALSGSRLRWHKLRRLGEPVGASDVVATARRREIAPWANRPPRPVPDGSGVVDVRGSAPGLAGPEPTRHHAGR